MWTKMIMVTLIAAVTLFSVKESLTQRQCTHGQVRLVGTQKIESQGRVEVCIKSLRWGTVCKDDWDDHDAAVVCYQLGYGRNGAVAKLGDNTSYTAVIKVNCDSSEERLLDCNRRLSSPTCLHGGGAAVRCRDEQLRVHNVSAATINTTPHTVMISWELNNSVPHQPNSFKVECFNQKHPKFSLSVNNGTVTQISVGGLIFSTSYNCCVLARYYYDTERRCSSMDNLPPEEFTTVTPASAQIFTTPASVELDEFISSDFNVKANIIGGVMGSIIVILLLLLAICGGALLYLLRCVVPKRSPQPHSANTTGMYSDNINYVIAPHSAAASGSQATQATRARAACNQSGSGAAAEYSRIGPLYDTTVNSRRQQPMAGRNRVSARLTERHEFSETHLAMASAAGRGGQGETAMEYEIPLLSGEHEKYSRVQH